MLKEALLVEPGPDTSVYVKEWPLPLPWCSGCPPRSHPGGFQDGLVGQEANCGVMLNAEEVALASDPSAVKV